MVRRITRQLNQSDAVRHDSVYIQDTICSRAFKDRLKKGFGRLFINVNGIRLAQNHENMNSQLTFSMRGQGSY